MKTHKEGGFLPDKTIQFILQSERKQKLRKLYHQEKLTLK